MIPNWLVQLFNAIPFINFAPFVESLNTTDRYDNDLIKLKSKFNEIESKFNNKEERLYEKINALTSANLPFPSPVLSSLAKVKNEYLAKRNSLRDEFDEISNSVRNKENIISAVKSMPSGSETEKFYNKQNNLYGGDKVYEQMEKFKTKIEDEV